MRRGKDNQGRYRFFWKEQREGKDRCMEREKRADDVVSLKSQALKCNRTSWA